MSCQGSYQHVFSWERHAIPPDYGGEALDSASTWTKRQPAAERRLWLAGGSGRQPLISKPIQWRRLVTANERLATTLAGFQRGKKNDRRVSQVSINGCQWNYTIISFRVRGRYISVIQYTNYIVPTMIIPQICVQCLAVAGEIAHNLGSRGLPCNPTYSSVNCTLTRATIVLSGQGRR